jgi:hypothetical protein
MRFPSPLAGAVAFAAGLVAVGIGAIPAWSATEVLVSPADLHGWHFFTNKVAGGPYTSASANPLSTATYEFRNGPGRPPAGSGSLLMAAGSEPDSRVSAVPPALVDSALDSLRSLSYETYVTSVGAGGAARAVSFKLAVQRAINPGFSTLLFEPGRQPVQTPATGHWQAWSPLGGLWWATGVSGTCSQPAPCSWSTMKSVVGGDSLIFAPYFELGESTNAYVGAASALDKVEINGTTWDLDNVHTSTTLTASPLRQRHGGPVTLTARAFCPGRALAGVVIFRSGHATLGTASPHGGTATLTTTALKDGWHAITADYSGDQQCAPSESSAVTVTVDRTLSTLPVVPVTG